MTTARRRRLASAMLVAVVLVLLGAATTYSVAALLAHLTPIERYELVSDEQAGRIAHAAGYFHARFQAPGVRRIVLEDRGDAAALRDESPTSALVRLAPPGADGAPRLLARPMYGDGWQAVAPPDAAPPGAVYLVAAGWPTPALRGRVQYASVPDQSLRQAWIAGQGTAPAQVDGALVTAPPTPVRLNLGPGVVPLAPIPVGFAAGTLLYGLLWGTCLGVAVWLRRRGRLRRGRCPCCAYDLRHSAAGGCPECGWGRPLAS